MSGMLKKLSACLFSEKNTEFQFDVGQKIDIKNPMTFGYGLNPQGFEIVDFGRDDDYQDGFYLVKADGEIQKHFKSNIESHFKPANPNAKLLNPNRFSGFEFDVGQKIDIKDPMIFGYGLNPQGFEIVDFGRDNDHQKGFYLVKADNNEIQKHSKNDIESHFKPANPNAKPLNPERFSL
jgi:hypothetical protein